MSKPIIEYRKCEVCSKIMPIYKYYENKRFCSVRCRVKIIEMPPRPDMTGHTPWNKGKAWPELSKIRQGGGNPNWKGNKVGYSQLHRWVNSKLEKPDRCLKCNRKKKLYLSNISYKYLRDLSDWEYLCHSCHLKKDYHSGKWGIASRKYAEEFNR